MILRAHSLDLPVHDKPLQFEIDSREAIDFYWRNAVHKQPRLWNGLQFLFDDVRIEKGVLRAQGYRSDYAAFLFWRANRHSVADKATHIAATSIPVTSDGALLAVRMAAHTANAGDYYFPAGSLDGDDLIDGHISIDHNIERELREETGIVASFDTDEPYVIAVDRGAWHVARRFPIGMSVAQAREQIERHQAETGDDETDDVIGIYNAADAQRLKTYARMLGEWHFANLSNEAAA